MKSSIDITCSSRALRMKKDIQQFPSTFYIGQCAATWQCLVGAGIFSLPTSTHYPLLVAHVTEITTWGGTVRAVRSSHMIVKVSTSISANNLCLQTQHTW